MVCVVSAAVLFSGNGYAPMEDVKLVGSLVDWMIEMMSYVHIVALSFCVFGLDMLCYTHCAPLERKRYMSPRWGFRIFARPVCYKHAAPLGLKN